VARIGCSGYGQGFPFSVPAVYFTDFHNCQRIIVHIAQDDAVTAKMTLLDRKCYRYRPEGAVGQAHFFEHSLVISPSHEAGQWRKATGGEEFQITQTAHRDLYRG